MEIEVGARVVRKTRRGEIVARGLVLGEIFWGMGQGEKTTRALLVLHDGCELISEWWSYEREEPEHP